MISTSTILQRIEHAKPLDFGGLFNQCTELFKTVWVQGLVMYLLTVALALPILIVVYVPLLFIGIIDGFEPANQGEISSLGVFALMLTMVLLLFALIAVNVLVFAFRAAFYKICKAKHLGVYENEDYFYFLKKPYLNKTISISLAHIGISVLASLLCFVPLIFACIPLCYMYVVYAFNPEKSVSDIIKISFQLGTKKWLITFGVFALSYCLAYMLGVFMCGIGIFVTMNFIFLPFYFIYYEIVGFKDEDEPKLLEV